MPDAQYHEKRKFPFIIGNVALSFLIFAGDIAIPMDVAGGVLYVVVVLIAMWLPERHVYFFSATSTLLIVVGSIDHFMTGMVWAPMANRAVAVLAVWITAILGLQRRRLTKALLRDAQIIGQVQDGVIVTDLEGCVTYWNQGSEAIFGYTEAEVLGRRISFLYPTELHDNLRRKIFDQLLLQGTLDLGVPGLRKSGDRFSTRQLLMVRRDDRGQAIGAVLYVQDVSERSDAELELRQLETFYQEVLDALPLQVAIFDTDGRFVYLNPASLSDPDSRRWVIGKTERDYFEKVGRNQAVVQERELYRERSLKDRKVVSFVEELQTRSGETRIFQHGFCPMMGLTGETSKVLGYRYDITDLNQAVEALSESLALNSAILDTAGDGIVSIDHNGIIEGLNPAALRLFDLDLEDAVGCHVDSLLSPGGPHENGSFFSDCLQYTSPADSVVGREAWVFRKDDSGIPVEVTVSEVRLSDRQLYTAILHDISGRRQAAKALTRYNERLEALRQIDQAILTTQSVRIVGEVAARHLLQMVPATSTTVVLFDFAADTADTLTVFSDASPTSLQAVSMDDFRTLIDTMNNDVGDISHDPIDLEQLSSPDSSDSTGNVAWLNIPLLVKESLIGILGLKGHEGERFDSEHIDIAREVAGPLARAIRNAQLFEEVDASRERLQALSRRLVQVQEAERRTLARELHDEIGQTLTGLKLLLETPGFPSEAGSSDLLQEARESVLRLLGRVRDLSLDLRPAMLDDLGLAPALLWLVERYKKQTGVEVDFKHSGMDRRLDPEVETAAYRIVQEALTNVARHSNVEQASVFLIASGNRISVTVKDEGSGFELREALASGSSSGLSGMHERVRLLGGTITIETAHNQGTFLTAELPV